LWQRSKAILWILPEAKHHEDFQMFTFLITASIGAYLSRNASIDLTEGCAGMTFNYDRVWADLIAFLTFIGAVYIWSINTGRKTRSYFDAVLLPWLRDRGIAINLPVIELPALPEAAHLN
jgi:hypothetical protein